MEMKYSQDVMDTATTFRKTETLEWWRARGLAPPLYTANAVNFASRNGSVEMLEWWLASGFEMKYTEYAMDMASSNGHIHVLEWWRLSGLELRYSEDAMVWATRCGEVAVLQWWAGILQSAGEHAAAEAVAWWKDSGLLEIKTKAAAAESSSLLAWLSSLFEWTD
ncbi:hypothetical protein DFJ73DRAFT_872031 [Zopfochytrium polystomum]|nr:hypothetical protein DFJ73DRAFT_872031 [Zopfochytrium polystomum]